MNRRQLLKAVAVGGTVMAFGRGLAFGREYFPSEVDEKLFEGINRAKDPANPIGLEAKHSAVIKAPDKVKAGEPFNVEVTIGKVIHPMSPSHWIESLELNIGNQPAGTVIFSSNGYVKPEAGFTVLLDENLKGKTVSLVVQDKCNLHGIWENYRNVEVM